MARDIQTRADLFERHPRPWSLHPEYPRPGHDSDADGVVLDARGGVVIGCSEWLMVDDGVLKQILEIVNGSTE